jgi:hypothetical protein
MTTTRRTRLDVARDIATAITLGGTLGVLLALHVLGVL